MGFVFNKKTLLVTPIVVTLFVYCYAYAGLSLDFTMSNTDVNYAAITANMVVFTIFIVIGAVIDEFESEEWRRIDWKVHDIYMEFFSSPFFAPATALAPLLIEKNMTYSSKDEIKSKHLRGFLIWVQYYIDKFAETFRLITRTNPKRQFSILKFADNNRDRIISAKCGGVYNISPNKEIKDGEHPPKHGDLTMFGVNVQMEPWGKEEDEKSRMCYFFTDGEVYLETYLFYSSRFGRLSKEDQRKIQESIDVYVVE